MEFYTIIIIIKDSPLKSLFLVLKVDMWDFCVLCCFFPYSLSFICALKRYFKRFISIQSFQSNHESTKNIFFFVFFKSVFNFFFFSSSTCLRYCFCTHIHKHSHPVANVRFMDGLRVWVFYIGMCVIHASNVWQRETHFIVYKVKQKKKKNKTWEVNGKSSEAPRFQIHWIFYFFLFFIQFFLFGIFFSSHCFVFSSCSSVINIFIFLYSVCLFFSVCALCCVPLSFFFFFSYCWVCCNKDK